jgi:UDP-N-acetylmuramyl pentapeptide phosphotransferase/UDP-N-acetylglucosamine-1-phosphate transferase
MTSRRWVVENYRGRAVARVLWIPVLALAVVWTLGVAAAAEVGPAGWGALVGILLVGAAGLVDDLVPVGPRGLRSHLRSLLEGHMTTGILKVLVGLGSAVVVVALQDPREGWVAVAGVLLVAACTNVWNGLDVRPGRALKAFLPTALVFALAADHADAPAIVGMLVAAVLALPADLRERAMLGDAGSNPLGFAAGVGLYAALPDLGVVLAAAAAVALNVLADTVTLSRAIDALPPLRWLDRLGRVPTAG